MYITKLTERDISSVATLLKTYWQEERGMHYSKKWTTDYLTSGHSKDIKNDLFFVLKDRGKLIGCISLVHYEGDVVEIRDFIIKKSCRNKNYEEHLFLHTLNWCDKHGIRKVYTLEDAHKKHFFTRHGFREEGLLKDHFKRGENLVILSLFSKPKEDVQQNLKKTLGELETRGTIAELTSQRLAKLRTR